MRVLLLLRGAPGCGKTTWIEGNNLKTYALSADDIRMMYQSPIMINDGTECVSPLNEKAVWKTLFELLEARMDRGEFVVIDATNSKTAEMNKYKKLADTYRYRIYCVDFTDVSITTCKKQNQKRPLYKQVPNEAIEKMYARFATQKIPSGITAIHPHELNRIWFKPIDLSIYNKIHHIGDIHGCCTVLKEYLKDGLKDDEFYIFTGDYIDRGIENVQVIEFLSEICRNKNVLLLEGNHEKWLWYWANGGTGKSREFETVTRKQLEQAEVDPKIVRMLYRSLGQCAWYTYKGKEVFVTHAGLSNLPENLTKVATAQMIHGVGKYGDYIEVAKNFEDNVKDVYQIFGHRNTDGSPIHMLDRTFNLEGRVEFGGNLRVVTLDENGFYTYEIPNTVYKEPEVKENPEHYMPEEISVMEMVDQMRKDRLIREKRYGDISSFNFTREAFYDRKWTNRTIKARGLFIDTVRGQVVARSYEKFFTVNERHETAFEFLKYQLKFPVSAYVKENGYLGLVFYDEENDDFRFCSKSTPEGPHVEWLKEAFLARVKHSKELKQFLKDEDVTLLFENVDMENDPHIIEYDHSDLYLLDIVKNQLTYQNYPPTQLMALAVEHGFTTKTRAAVLHDWEEFKRWYEEVNNEDYTFRGRQIEGFVIEDAVHYMLKIKLPYYTFWKHMRSVADEVFRTGTFRRTGSLTTAEANYFYGFCQKIKDEENHPTRLVDLRKQFYQEYQKQGD